MDSNTSRAGANLSTQIRYYNTTGSYSGGKTLGKLGYKNGLPGFDPTDKDLQTLSKAAYKHDPTVAGFTFVPSLSTYESKVYVRPGSDTVIVAFKGTDPTSLDDIRTDIGLAAGHLGDSARTKRSREIITRVRSTMPGKRIVVTGHSLGASLAREVSNDPGVTKAVGFNTGYEVASTGILGNAMKRHSKEYHAKHHRSHPRFSDYVNTRDPVSVGVINKRKGNHTYYTRGFALKAHRPTYFK